MLEETWGDSAYAKHRYRGRHRSALRVNERLWVIEDDIRDKERAQAFDAEFIRLARAVYVENDERAAIKRRINVTLGSASSKKSPTGLIRPEFFASRYCAAWTSVYSAPQ
jgi:hypothetical protein